MEFESVKGIDRSLEHTVIQGTYSGAGDGRRGGISRQLYTETSLQDTARGSSERLLAQRSVKCDSLSGIIDLYRRFQDASRLLEQLGPLYLRRVCSLVGWKKGRLEKFNASNSHGVAWNSLTNLCTVASTRDL